MPMVVPGCWRGPRSACCCAKVAGAAARTMKPMIAVRHMAFSPFAIGWIPAVPLGHASRHSPERTVLLFRRRLSPRLRLTGQDDKQVWEDYYARISARRAA